MAQMCMHTHMNLGLVDYSFQLVAFIICLSTNVKLG